MSKEIAIPISSGKDLDAPFDTRFGRTPYFLLTDAEGKHFEVVSNPGASAAHGAGTGAAALMHDKKIKHVVAGHFGPKAAQALNAFGIHMWLASEGQSAAQVLEAWNKKKLRAFR